MALTLRRKKCSRPPRSGFLLPALLTFASIAVSPPCRADNVVPAAVELPATLTLQDALALFHKRGLDLLIADAATRNAEGAVMIAGAVANPVVTTGIGNALTYSTSHYSMSNCLASGATCPPWIYNVGITDSAAIEDAVLGKRDLRLKVARNALAAAKLSRVDAERTLTLQVKSAFVQVAQAILALRFARDVASTQATTLRKARERYKAGATNEGDVQRIEAQKLESEQALDTAEYTLRATRFGLGFLLGARGTVPDFDVDTAVLDFTVPASLKDASGLALLRTAFAQRPDLLGAGYAKQSAAAQLQLVKRNRFPDITVGANYAWGGYGGVSTNGPLQGPTLSFSLSAPIPVFYGLQGEQRQAEAQYDTNALQEAKATAQVTSDVAGSVAAFVTARKLVERMEGPRRDGGGLLQSARGAFEVVATQYEKGGASLTDYLDALRTYIATRTEYFADLSSYWTAVFQLEAAIGRDLP